MANKSKYILSNIKPLKHTSQINATTSQEVIEKIFDFFKDATIPDNKRKYFLGLEEIKSHEGWDYFVGHYVKCAAHKNIEIVEDKGNGPEIGQQHIIDASDSNDIFVILSKANELIMAHKAKKGKLDDFRNEVRHIFNSTYKLVPKPPIALFELTKNLGGISSIKAEVDSGGKEIARNFIKKIQNHDFPFQSKTFDNSFKDKGWIEHSANGKFGEKLIKFSDQYSNWLKESGLAHKEESLIEFINNTKVCVKRRIEAIVLLSSFCNQIRCEIQGNPIKHPNLTWIIDSQFINRSESVIQIHAPKDESDPAAKEIIQQINSIGSTQSSSS